MRTAQDRPCLRTYLKEERMDMHICARNRAGKLPEAHPSSVVILVVAMAVVGWCTGFVAVDGTGTY